jgi:hypothetical protein
MKTTLRTFEPGDWDAFAGAEPFEDGTDPLIGSFHLFTKMGVGGPSFTPESTILFDAYGAAAYLGDEHDDFGGWVMVDERMTPAKAHWLASNIRSVECLKALGFVPAQEV